MTTLELAARAPFNFYNTVRSHGWYQLAPMAWDEERHVLRKVERLANGRVVEVVVTGTAAGVTANAAGRLGKREREEIARKVAWMFMLDADFSEFYRETAGEPYLKHCSVNAYGRQLRSTSLFEDVIKVMMTTNIQWGGTIRLVKALVDHFGEPLAADPAQRAFPSAEKISRSREGTLRKLGLGYRAPYVLKLARGVASGEIDLDALNDPAHDTAHVRRALIALPGIGPYAAASLLMLLQRYDHIGIDTEAMSTVSTHFYGGRPVGEKEINAVFERFGRFRALAYWFWDYSGMGQTPMEQWESQAR